jgi:flagellar protein FlaI
LRGSTTKPRIVNSEESMPQTTAVIRPLSRRFATAKSEIKVASRPCFSSSWIEEAPGQPEAPVDTYDVHGISVRVFSPKDSSCGIYAIDLPEYHLNPSQLQMLSEAISRITTILPMDVDLSSLGVARPFIKEKAKDYVYGRLAIRSARTATDEQLELEADHLAELLCRYTAGFGVLETLIRDENVQDVYIDAPSSQVPVHLVLRSGMPETVRQKCRTNIFVGRRDLQGLVSKIKFETGLPFSEAHPVLEAELKRLDARITLVGPPLSEKGVSVAIRKHATETWTMPMLVANGTLSPLLASFLWACVIGRRTVLVAGSRGAGKTTLLAAMMLEFPLSQRMILIEDTPEIPIRRIQDLGYDLQAFRFSGGGEQVATSAREALKVSLRMGESAIIIGEVRGEEASVLYESMRAGSAGSSVLGTIHANSARGVLDRAVEDLGVSERAFSSTDIIVVIDLVRSPDGTRFSRKVAEVSEVAYENDKVRLVPLFEIEPGCHCAKPREGFSENSRAIMGIASSLGTTSARILEIVKTRAHSDQIFSEKLGPSRGLMGMAQDRLRVQSNEVLSRDLFSLEGPESGLSKWRAWFENAQSKPAE